MPHSNAGLHLISKELESAEGAVLDMPRQYNAGRTFVGDILVQQMYHQRPIPYSMDEKPDPRPVIIEGRHVNPAYLASHTVADNLYYRYLLALVRGGKNSQTCHGVDELAELGFSAIVFREDAIAPEYLDTTRASLKRCLRAGTRADGRQIFLV